MPTWWEGDPGIFKREGTNTFYKEKQRRLGTHTQRGPMFFIFQKNKGGAPVSPKNDGGAPSNLPLYLNL